MVFLGCRSLRYSLLDSYFISERGLIVMLANMQVMGVNQNDTPWQACNSSKFLSFHVSIIIIAELIK